MSESERAHLLEAGDVGPKALELIERDIDYVRGIVWRGVPVGLRSEYSMYITVKPDGTWQLELS